MLDFDYLQPSSVAEASRMLADLGDDARILAGGSALMLAMRQRMLSPSHLISLAGIEALRGIHHANDGTLHIGALTRHGELAASALVQQHWPVLADMAHRVANPQVRNQGTLGGNLCYGDPATDPPCCLLALDASVVAVSTRGERVLPMAEFLVDYFTTALAPDEVLTEIRVPAMHSGTRGHYARFLRTAAEHRPLVSVGVTLQMDGGICTQARIAVGASVVVAQRLPRAEALLTGHAITAQRARDAAAAVAEDIEPLSDARGSADYRRDMVRVVAQRTVAGLCGLQEE